MQVQQITFHDRCHWEEKKKKQTPTSRRGKKMNILLPTKLQRWSWESKTHKIGTGGILRPWEQARRKMAWGHTNQKTLRQAPGTAGTPG